MKAARFAALLPAIAIEKCPVTSDAPIAEASSEAFDRRLEGTWRCMSESESSVSTVRIESRTPTVLAIFFQGEGGFPDSATVQSAKLGGKKVANMGSRDAGKQEWHVVRFRLPQSNVMQMDVLMGDLSDTLSAAATKKAIERLAKEDSFEESLLCGMKGASK